MRNKNRGARSWAPAVPVFLFAAMACGCLGFTGPLQSAAAAGDTQKVKVLLDQGGDANDLNEYGRTPLFAAAFKGHADVVKLLLERGAKVDEAAVPGGWTPLIAAAQHGHTEVVQLLLDHGARLDLQSDPPVHWTAYEWAQNYNRYKTMAVIKRFAEQKGLAYRGSGGGKTTLFGAQGGSDAPRPAPKRALGGMLGTGGE